MHRGTDSFNLRSYIDCDKFLVHTYWHNGTKSNKHTCQTYGRAIPRFEMLLICLPLRLPIVKLANTWQKTNGLMTPIKSMTKQKSMQFEFVCTSKSVFRRAHVPLTIGTTATGLTGRCTSQSLEPEAARKLISNWVNVHSLLRSYRCKFGVRIHPMWYDSMMIGDWWVCRFAEWLMRTILN